MPEAAPVIHDRGFILGDGLFETVLIRRGAPVLWQEHVDRLLATAAAVLFPLPEALPATARGALDELLPLVEGAGDRGALRITVTRGSGTAYGLEAPTDVQPTVMLRLTPARARDRGRAKPRGSSTSRASIPETGCPGTRRRRRCGACLAHQMARQQGASLALLAARSSASANCLVVEGRNAAAQGRGHHGVIDHRARRSMATSVKPTRPACSGRASAECILKPADLHRGERGVHLVERQRHPPACCCRRPPATRGETPVCDWLHERYEALSE